MMSHSLYGPTLSTVMVSILRIYSKSVLCDKSFASATRLLATSYCFQLFCLQPLSHVKTWLDNLIQNTNLDSDIIHVKLRFVTVIFCSYYALYKRTVEFAVTVTVRLERILS